MKRYFFLFIILLLTSHKGFGQQFFVATDNGPLEMVTMTPGGPVSVAVPGCGTNNYFSIAIFGSTIYYISTSGILYSGDITGGSSPSITNCTPISYSVGGNSLTVDSQGVLYYASGFQVYSIDPRNPVPNLLGTMPFSSAGDLTFYNNQLFMSAPQGIIKVDLNNPSQSSLYISMPGTNLLGLATINLNGNYTIYALNSVGESTSMLELDMQNKVVKGVVGTLPYSCYDAGSSVESGIVPKTTISSFKVNQQCDALNQGQISVTCLPDTDQYRFTLNGTQSNTTGAFTNLAPGRYQLMITSNGVQAVKDTAFVIPDYTINNPVITATIVNPVCNKTGQIQLDAGVADTAYSIKFGNDTVGFDHIFTGLAAGAYRFIILNKKGCISGEQNYTLQQQPCPIEIDTLTVSQECDTLNRARVSIICSPAAGNYVFQLNTGQVVSTGIFDNLLPGNYQITITESGDFLPKDTTFAIPDFTIGNPVISTNLTNPICSKSGQIKLDAGTADASYSIRYGKSIFSFDHTFSGLAAGTYHFAILNSKGCITDEKDYTLQQDVCPPIRINTFQVTQECDTLNKGRVAISCQPDTAKYVFTLNTGQTDTTGIFDNLAPGNYQLTITSNDNLLPKDTTFTIPNYTINSLLITAALTDPVCDKPGEIKLDAGSGNSIYKVKFGNKIFGFDHIFTGLTAGAYRFIILNSAGCVAGEKDCTLLQDICPPIVIEMVQVDPECDVFGQAKITVSTKPHPDDYLYTLNNISDTTGVFDLLNPGIYELVITSSGGDTLKQQVTVPDYSLNKPAVTYALTDVECEIPGQIKFNINGDSKGSVNIKYGSELYPIGQTIKDLTPGMNFFSLLDQNGCVVDTINVNVPQVDCSPVVFPNAFTPNGDGVNDIFRPNQNSNPVTFDLSVFNRWGTLVFRSKSIYDGWDGKYNNKDVPVGVYYWIATYTMPDNKKGTQSGYVTLIR